MKKRTLIKVCILISFALGILLYWYYEVEPYYRVVNNYQKAEELIAQENFSEAHKLLMSIRFETDDYQLSHYKDTEKLIFLCQSHFAYEQGDIEEAYEQFNIWDLNIGMDYQTEEQAQAIREYCNKVKAEYAPIAAAKEWEEKAAKLEKIRSGLPYKGMLEIYIDDTILGPASSDVSTGEMYKTGKIIRQEHTFTTKAKN